MNTEEFIKKAKKVHGDKYDYSKVNYINSNTKVCIICPIHGEFWQRPNNHLNGCGCSKCTKFRNKYTTEEWIEYAKSIHGNKYDYSKVIYKTSKDNVIIICPEHGEFNIRPDNHNHGEGCPVCRYIKSSNGIRKNIDEFISQCKKVHGNKYDYSKVEYKNNKTKVCIVCPKHGEFWQTPDNHLSGKGCPRCSQSKLEESTKEFLIENDIPFEEQKSFEWLKFKSPMRLDFYLPQYNVAIECQGIQHFKPLEHFGGNEAFEYSIEKDKKKASLCAENGIKLMYFSNERYGNFLGEKVYHSLSKLIKGVK
jgi:hypothetical protein